MELYISIFSLQVSEETMTCFASYVPGLRWLMISGVEGQACIEKTVKFCERLKNLNRLSISPKINESLMIRFLRACPSLRFISSALGPFWLNPFTSEALPIFNTAQSYLT